MDGCGIWEGQSKGGWIWQLGWAGWVGGCGSCIEQHGWLGVVAGLGRARVEGREGLRRVHGTSF